MRPHNVTGWRRTDPRWSPEKCESNHLNSATSHRQTHEENKLPTHPTPCWSPSVPSCIIAALFTVPLTSSRGLFLPATSDNRKQVRSLSTGKPLVKSKPELVDLLLSPSVLATPFVSSFVLPYLWGWREEYPAKYSLISKKQNNYNVLDGTKLLTQRVERVLPLRSAHASLEEWRVLNNYS